jgi:ribosome-associated translation inhibitor RaiA
MQIQVHTDNHITGREDVVRLVHASVEGTISRFSDRITRVEAHLSDTNGHKSKGDDFRCVLEARLAGLQPIVVSHQAPTIELAVAEAAEKLERSIESKLGRIHDRVPAPEQEL